MEKGQKGRGKTETPEKKGLKGSREGVRRGERLRPAPSQAGLSPPLFRTLDPH